MVVDGGLGRGEEGGGRGVKKNEVSREVHFKEFMGRIRGEAGRRLFF